MKFCTLKEASTAEIVEKKSRFIANSCHIESKEEAEEKINLIKKKYYDAKHNCFAFSIVDKDGNLLEKSSDDGEPSGTAGAPILNVIRKNNLNNVLIVVTRYFGGILLGTGGLVRCYSAGCLGAIEKVETIEIELGFEMTITLDYPDFQNVQYYFGKKGINILDSKYENDIECVVEMSILTKEEFLADVKNRNINIKKVEIGKSKYVKIYHK